MKLKLNVKLGNKTVEVTFEAQNLQDALLEAGALLGFDGICGMCKGNSIKIRTRITGEEKNKYSEFVCNDCNAILKIRIHKGNLGTYVTDWEEPFSSSNQG